MPVLGNHGAGTIVPTALAAVWRQWMKRFLAPAGVSSAGRPGSMGQLSSHSESFWPNQQPQAGLQRGRWVPPGPAFPTRGPAFSSNKAAAGQMDFGDSLGKAVPCQGLRVGEASRTHCGHIVTFFAGVYLGRTRGSRCVRRCWIPRRQGNCSRFLHPYPPSSPSPQSCSSLPAACPGPITAQDLPRAQFLPNSPVFPALTHPHLSIFSLDFTGLLNDPCPCLSPPRLPHCAHKCSTAPYCSQSECLAPRPGTQDPSEWAP